MINVLVNGANGRMGQHTVKAVEAHPTLNYVAGLDQHSDLHAALKQYQPDVVVDFTVASAGFANAKCLIEQGVRPVIGTSGFSQADVAQLQTLAAERKLGGLIAPNFSIGAVLMMQFAESAARYFPQAEIVETHHRGKQDAPSGTAIKTAEMIAAGRQQADSAPACHEIIAHARGATHQDIPIHSLRLSGTLAEQTVLFGSTGETLRLQHITLDRDCFMPGVILACEKVVELDRLIYGLEHIL